MSFRSAGLTFVLAGLVGLGCSSNGDSSTAPPPPPPSSQKPVVDDGTVTGAVAAQAASDEWVAGENKKGIRRFKDPGFYVDGVPLGIIKFGELPITLEPYWHKEKASLEFSGKNAKQYKIVEQRRYRFVDYAKAMGVDVKAIKAVHLYGGAKRKVAVSISGKQLEKLHGLMFRFGSDVFGKAIPACPFGLTSGNCPDNLNAIAVYIKREPPVKKGGAFYLGDQRIDGIPYFGDPIRGGVRVYQDGPLVAHIKRHMLWKLRNESFKLTGPDGKTRWKFMEFLRSQGVKTDGIVEAWLIHKDQRIKRIPRSELLTSTFAAAERKGGQILFGDENLPTHAIALHNRRVSEKELPVIRDYERHD